MLFLIFCLAAVAMFVLVASRGKKNGSGQQAVAVNPYPAGTQLQATSTLPSNFPKDVLREQYPVEKSTIVNYPDGRTNVTVSYLSPNTVFSLLSVYTEYFKSSYWKMQSSELLQNSGVVVAKNVGDLSDGGIDLRIREGFLDRLEVLGVGDDFKHLFSDFHVFGARFQGNR